MRTAFHRAFKTSETAAETSSPEKRLLEKTSGAFGREHFLHQLMRKYIERQDSLFLKHFDEVVSTRRALGVVLAADLALVDEGALVAGHCEEGDA